MTQPRTLSLRTERLAVLTSDCLADVVAAAPPSIGCPTVECPLRSVTLLVC